LFVLKRDRLNSKHFFSLGLAIIEAATNNDLQSGDERLLKKFHEKKIFL
jgi:hypothetical protein